MNKFTIPFLIAASDMIDKRKEILPKLAQQLGVPLNGLFYLWMFRRSEMEQVGIIKNNKRKYFFKKNDWKYFFHGIDCDLWNTKDGRFLAVSFGPSGRIDVFEAGDVSRFVFTSKSPWPEYIGLKEFLFEKKTSELHKRNETEPKFRGLPIIPLPNWAKIELLIDELEDHKFMERPDPELYKLRKSHTITNDEGRTVINIPPTTTEKEWLDSLVCDRWIISAKGKDQIKNSKKNLK